MTRSSSGFVDVLSFKTYSISLAMFYPLPVWTSSSDLIVRLGSAVAVERVFSGRHDTNSLRRISLHPDTIHINVESGTSAASPTTRRKILFDHLCLPHVH